MRQILNRILRCGGHGDPFRWLPVIGGTVCWVILLTSCMVGPEYQKPAAEVPETWDNLLISDNLPPPTITEAAPPDIEWWKVFENDELTELIQQAIEHNHDVREASFRVLEARALSLAARAGLYPQLNGDGSYTRIRRSETILIAPTSGAPQGFAPPGANFDIWNSVLDLRWELDLWGRIRRSMQATEAEAQSVEMDRRGIVLSLISEVGQTYFRIRELDELVHIARKNLALRQESLQLLQSRADAGLASELDIQRAKVLVDESAAQIPDLLRQRAAQVHRLAVLIGKPPHAVKLAPRPLRTMVVQPVIPVGMPSELLERRPDIVQVEHSLIAAHARIGEARAFFFPSIAITGTGGFQTSEFKQWFNWSSRTMSIGPSVTIPIFQGYTNVARLKVAESRYQQLLERYHQTILAAFQEVADLLTALQTRTEQLSQLRKQVAAAQAAHDLAKLRYQKGLVNYIDVLDAQRTVLAAEQTLVQVERARLSEMIVLFKAVGGGWM
ncbi:MAG: efflux transporter outer membrane subunit [Nitrospirae bacterium]|nr:MAG: efflux transporter outer membrane subunit [Nitrospirota bacterium]